MFENQSKSPANTDLALAWSAAATGALAVFAWATCCVLPLALSIAGLSLAGTAWIAGGRHWLTAATLVVQALGWWGVIWRRRQCRRDSACAPPSPLTLGLLSAAAGLAVAALAWGPVIEPRALALLRPWR